MNNIEVLRDHWLELGFSAEMINECLGTPAWTEVKVSGKEVIGNNGENKNDFITKIDQ